MIQFYIAPIGADTNPGTADRPFVTLAQARDAVREATRNGLPPGGVVVWLRGGDYLLKETFTLAADDGGTAESPVTYRASEGETVRLLGGRVIRGFEPVRDPAVLARLAAPARAHVLQVDLRAAGVTNFGRLSSRGFGRKSQPAHLELFFAGQPMTLAQWPNAGEFTTIAGVTEPINDEWGQPVGKLTGGFTYDGDRPRGWAPTDDLWVHGYWSWDWANSYEHVRTLDVERRVIETDPPHGSYYFRAGQRFYFLNVLEELDQPGEYYLDRATGILYFWPPAPLETGEVLVSELETPLIRVDGASHLTLRGLTLEAGRDSGVVVQGGEGVTLTGCVIRNVGTWGAIVDGRKHIIDGCDIAYTGDGGIQLDGGDRATLTPANHVARNNHIHHIGRWSRCYQAGILAGGVGITITHNLIHDGPHTAILYNGNDFTIDYNEIYRMCLETGDAGAIYTGRDYTYRGNAIRYNFVHNLGGVGMGCSCIYMDDCVSGHEIRGNIVWGSDGIWLGGGRDFIIENNVFVDCPSGIFYDSRGTDSNPVWVNMIRNIMKPRLDAMHYLEPPYSTRYPLLATYKAFYDKGEGVPCGNNRVARNISVGGRWLFTWSDTSEEVLGLQDNLRGTGPIFADRADGHFTPRADSLASSIGFTPIPEAQIGLIVDEFRPTLPPKVVSLLEMGEKRADGRLAIRLLLHNVGDLPVTGDMQLAAKAKEPVIWIDEPSTTFTLAPGETKIVEFTLQAQPEELVVSAFSATLGVRPSRLRF